MNNDKLTIPRWKAIVKNAKYLILIISSIWIGMGALAILDTVLEILT